MKHLALFFALGTIIYMVAPADAQWNNWVNVNEFTDEKLCWAGSPWVPPTRQMAFPYGDVESRLVVYCTTEYCKPSIAFLDRPNISGSGDDFYVNMRWDSNEPVRMRMYQSSSTSQLWFNQNDREGDSMVKKEIVDHSTLLIAIPWFQQRPIFRFSLMGSGRAIGKAIAECGQDPAGK